MTEYLLGEMWKSFSLFWLEAYSRIFMVRREMMMNSDLISLVFLLLRYYELIKSKRDGKIC